jgi:hypothetical protein
MQPAYGIENFVRDCAVGTSKAFVAKDAAITAKSDFNLNTQASILEFIGNGGLENPTFINSKIWEKNSNPNTVIMVDAYTFCSGLIYGYLAFRFQDKTGLWTIKSFKKNRDPDTRNLVFQQQLSKLFGEH